MATETTKPAEAPASAPPPPPQPIFIHPSAFMTGAHWPPGMYPPPIFAYPPPTEGADPNAPPVPYVMIAPPPGMVYAYPPPPPGQAYTYPPPMPPTVPAPVEDTPKPKRKQVKQACTNCAAACKRCDDERPCGRCTKYGIGESCIDGKRKERQKGIKRGPYKRRAKEANAADTSTEQVDSPPPAPASTSEAEAQPVLPPPEGYPPYMIPPGYYPPPPPGDPNAPPPVDGAAHPPYYHFPPMPYPPYGYPPPPGSSPPTLIAPQTVAPAATSVQPKEDEQSAALSPQSDAASPEPPRKKARLDKAREPEVLERDELREEPEEEEQNGDS